MRNLLLVLTALAWLPSGWTGEPFLQRSWLSEDGLPGNFVRSVVQAPDRFLWVATAEGVVRFDGDRFSVPGGTVDQEITRLRPKTLFPLPDGSVWIATEAGGLIRWRERVWTLVWPASTQAGVAEVTQVVAGPEGAVLVARAAEVWRASSENAPLVRLEAVTPEIAALLAGNLQSWRSAGRSVPGSGAPELHDQLGRRWFSGPHRELTVETPDGRHLPVLPADSGVTELAEDHEGNIWVAHESGGLRCLRDRRVEMLQDESGQPGAATCLLEDHDGVLWIGDRRGGLDRLEKGALTHLKLKDGSIQRAVCVLFEDSKLRLWAGTRDGSLFVRRDGEFVTYGSGPPLSKANGMAEDHSGRLWIAGAYGLAVLEGDSVHLKAGAEALNGRLSTLVITPEQEVWLGTSEGAIYHGRTSDPGPPKLDETATRLSRGCRISSFFHDSTGLLWAATHGAGLLRFHRETGWTVYDAAAGLPDLRLTAVLEDPMHHLWVGSLGGIFRLKRNDLMATQRPLPWLRLDRSDGLTTRECTGYSQPSAWRSRDETLWFPTSRGVARIRGDALHPATAPDPVIESATAGDTVMHPEIQAGVLQAGPGRSRLEFRFTVPSFTAPEKIRFRTRLTGLDDSWRESGSLRTAAYDAVPPGNYEFEVTAVDGDGTSGRIASLPVQILPHWWESLSFRIAAGFLAAAAAIGIGWLLARQRAKQRIARLQLRHAQETERARIARDLHDDLGASLTEISLLAGLSAEEAPDGPHRQSLETIAARAQTVAGTLDEIVWAVDPRHDTSASLVEYLSSWGQEFLGRAGIHLRLDIPRDLIDFPMEAERRHALFLAVREALHNIIKHSGASMAWLRMKSTPQSLIVVVEDTGKGFAPASIKRGNGLENYRERMKTCGGTVSLITAPGEGTRLEFRIPLPPPPV
jgi:signal transduction histidine kinase/ligand-binding sensor domain-containing protein